MISKVGPSLHFRHEGKSTDGSETLPDMHRMSSVYTNGETTGELCVRTEATTNEVQL